MAHELTVAVQQKELLSDCIANPHASSLHCAAQITTVDEASQFYPLFGLGANVALIFSGRAVKIFSQIRAELPPDVDGWGLSLRGLMGMVVIGGFLIAAIYYWLQRTVVPRVQKRESKKKKKAKMSVGESFTFLAGSRCGAGWRLLMGVVNGTVLEQLGCRCCRCCTVPLCNACGVTQGLRCAHLLLSGAADASSCSVVLVVHQVKHLSAAERRCVPCCCCQRPSTAMCLRSALPVHYALPSDIIFPASRRCCCCRRAGTSATWPRSWWRTVSPSTWWR